MKYEDAQKLIGKSFLKRGSENKNPKLILGEIIFKNNDYIAILHHIDDNGNDTGNSYKVGLKEFEDKLILG